MNGTPSDVRKDHELEHGKFLAPNAIEIWGWGTPAGQERAKRRAHLLLELGHIQSGMKVLEYGCGTGLFSRQLGASGASLVSIDLSPDLIVEAKKEPVPNVTYLVGDIEALDFPTGSFDAVVGSSVLHHVDFVKALTEAFRVLKSGGRVAFAEPNMLNPQIALQKNVPFIKRRMGDSPDETAFFRWTIRRTLQKIGFTDVVVKPHDFLHPAIPASLIPFVKRCGNLLEATPLVREIAGSLLFAGTKPTSAS
jgi:2-polyprenyl-3-methyl-5-hydroxy-6-metoxy-1,4-benzoquinol methylase